MFSFGRSSTGDRSKAGSEVSKSKRRDEDENESTVSRRKSRTNMSTDSLASRPRRKPSKRDDDEDERSHTTSKSRRSENIPPESATYTAARPREERAVERSEGRQDDLKDHDEESRRRRSRAQENPERALALRQRDRGDSADYRDYHNYSEDSRQSRIATSQNGAMVLSRGDNEYYWDNRDDDDRSQRNPGDRSSSYAVKRSANGENYVDRDERKALVRRNDESRAEYDERSGRDASRIEPRTSKSEKRGTRDDHDDQRRTTTRSDSDAPRRRRRSERESSRALDNHDAALPQNQFFSDPSTYTAPYRPPTLGHAADYYGDQGESVHYQPGVRPNPPSYVVNAEQLHLQTPTVDAKPPPEPSQSGQLGASASFFAMNSASEAEDVSGKPSKPNNVKPSPRASPKPSRPSQSSAGINPMAVAAAGAGAGAAMSYFGSTQSSQQQQSYQQQSQQWGHGAGEVQNSSNFQQNHSYGPPARPQYQQGSLTQEPADMYGPGSRPPQPHQSGSGSHGLGTAAAVGLAGAAAGAYMSHQHQQHHPSFHQQSFSGAVGGGTNGGFQLGQNQSAFPGMQQQKLRRKRTGPLGKLANWWNAPSDVAQFEEYTEAIGVCKDCFDPDSPPGHGPRKHHYHRKLRREPSRYGSNLRVDKPYRHSSSDEERKPNSSRMKKAAAVGLAGLGAAKIGEKLYTSKHDFDDTYSVQSGKPTVQQRTSYSRRDDGRIHSRHSSQEDLRLQRKSSRNKLDRRRRSSSSSEQGLSRGNVASVAAGAAALGVAAEAAHRRRSRSRSRERHSSQRKYYSKRVSPRHSYVDLSTSQQGTTGFGSFFSSPSANQKHGKKPKGMFAFSNASSSDDDLAFGEGTVKRRDSGKSDRKDDRRRKEKYGKTDTAAILGLAAAGAALATETDRKGKDRKYADRRVDETPARQGRKINLQDHDTNDENDDIWEDATDDESVGDVDMALAYGGRLSGGPSRESLASQSSGTGKWDWRWNKNKKEREEKRLKRKQSMEANQSQGQGFTPERPVLSVFQPAPETREQPESPFARKTSAQANPFSSDNVMPGAFDGSAPEFTYGPSPMSGQNLQYIDPRPLSESVTPSAFSRESSTSFNPRPQNVATASSLPLQQPQPQSPIMGKTANIESIASQPSYQDDWAHVQRESRPREDFESKRISAATTPKRITSPDLAPLNASTLSKQSVSWALTPEQLDTERRAHEKEEKRRRKREKEERRRTTDSADLLRRTEGEDAGFGVASIQPDIKQQSSRRASLGGESSRTEADIDAEIRRLRDEQKRKQEERKRQQFEDEKKATLVRTRDEDDHLARKERDREEEEQRRESIASGATAAAIAAGAGVAAIAAMSGGRKGSSSDSDSMSKRRRKSSLRQGSKDKFETPLREVADVSNEPESTSAPRETAQERIARIAARRVSRTPSPVYEDYGEFFMPEELKNRVAKPSIAEQRGDIGAHVVDIAPPDEMSITPVRRKSAPFDPQYYEMFGLDPEHDPLAHPWRVPQLSLIEATPPASLRDPASPMVMAPQKTIEPEPEDFDQPPARKRSNSRVSWGDHDTYVYEARTPDYEQDDPVRRMRDVEDAKVPGNSASPDPEDLYIGRNVAQEETGPTEEYYRPKPERLYTLDDDADENNFMDRAAKSVQGMATVPEVREPSPERVQEDHPPNERNYSSAEPTPLDERDLADLLGAKSFYQSPFAQTANDIDLQTPQSTRPDLERIQTLDETPAEGVPTRPADESNAESYFEARPSDEGSRPTRSEARRAARALSSDIADVVPAPPPPPPLPTEGMLRQVNRSAPAPSEVPLPPSRQASEVSRTTKSNTELRGTYTSIADAAAAAAVERTRKRTSMSATRTQTVAKDDVEASTQPRRERSVSLTNGKSRDDSVFDYLASSSSDDKNKTRKAKSEVGTTSKAAMIAAATAAMGGITARRTAADQDAPKPYRDPRQSLPNISAAKSDDLVFKRKSLPDLATAAQRDAEIAIPPAPLVEPNVHAAKAEPIVSTITAEPDFYAAEGENSKTKEDKRSRRKSKRDSGIFDDDDTRSMASIPADEESSKKRSKRSSKVYDDDDDTRSVKSTSSKSGRKSRDRDSKRGSDDDDDTRSVKSTSSKKDKKIKEESKPGGFFSNIFSTSKSEVSTPRRKDSKSSRSEVGRRDDSEDDGKRRKKHRSKSSASASVPDLSKPPADYEISPGISRRGTGPDTGIEARDRSTDDGFVSAQDEQSFLAKRPEMSLPTAIMDVSTGTDGVSGLLKGEVETHKIVGKEEGTTVPDESYYMSGAQAETDKPEESYTAAKVETEAPTITDLLTNHPRALSAVQPDLVAEAVANAAIDSGEETAFEISEKDNLNRPRALSVINTASQAKDPLAASSPTSKRVPLFRRLPITPRTGTKESASSPILAPSSPMTPKTRQNRPKSTEFSSREFKPLYLVERHTPAKTESPIAEEPLPPLPSSRATSVYGSTEDLPSLAAGALSDGETEGKRGRSDRRRSWSGGELGSSARDILDSRSVTPVPNEKQRAILQQQQAQAPPLRARKELPKDLFHSPSELLQDPAFFADLHQQDFEELREGSPLPSVVSTVDDQEFLSAESRPETPTADWNRSPPPQEQISSVASSPPARRASPFRSPPAAASPQLRALSRTTSTEVTPVLRAMSKSPVPVGGMTPPARAQSASPFKHRTSSNISARAAALFGGTALGLAIGNVAAERADHENAVRDQEAVPSQESQANADEESQRPSISLTEPTPVEPVRPEQPHEFSPKLESQAEEPLQLIDSPQDAGRMPDLIVQTDESMPMPEATTAMVPDQSHWKTEEAILPTQSSTIPEQVQAQIDEVTRELEHEAVPLEQQPAETGTIRDLQDGMNTSSSLGEALAESWGAQSSSDQKGMTREDYFAASETSRQERHPSYEPTEEDLDRAYHDHGAFEIAFARAARSRGLAGDVTREEALESFLPKRHNAPFVPKDNLSPIAGSLASSMIASPEKNRSTSEVALDVREDEPNLAMQIGGKKEASKKDKRKSKKDKKKTPSSRLSQEFTSGEASEGASRDVELDQLQDVPPEMLEAALQEEAERRALAGEAKMFEDDAVQSPSTLSQPDATIGTSEDAAKGLETIEPEVESVAIEEPGNKQIDLGQLTKGIEVGNEQFPVSDVEQLKNTAVVDVPIEPETPLEDITEPDELFKETGKKRKKDKKGKKKSSTGDLLAPALAAAGAIGAAGAVAGLLGDDKEESETAFAEAVPLPESARTSNVNLEELEGARQLQTEDTADVIGEVIEDEPPLAEQVPWDFGLSSKDKKKKEKTMRKNGTWDSRITQEDVDAVSVEQSRDAFPAETGAEQPETIESPFESIPLTEAEEVVPAEDDEWAAPASGKKTKKGKDKKKKKQSIVLEEPTTMEEVEQMPDKSQEIDVLEPVEGALIVEPEPETVGQPTTENSTGPKSGQESRIPEPELDMQANESSRAAELQVNEEPTSITDITHSVEEEQTATPGIVLDILNRRQSLDEASGEQTGEIDPASMPLPERSRSEIEFEDLIPTADDNQLVEPAPEPVVEPGAPVVQAVEPKASEPLISHSVDDTPAVTTEDDAWAMPSKKSKKKDKKKRKSTIDWSIDAAEPDQAGPSTAGSQALDTTDDRHEKIEQIAAVVVAEPETIGDAIQATEVAKEIEPVEETAVPNEILDPAEESRATSQAEPEAGEDEWAVPTKKSKKDKKKSKKGKSITEPEAQIEAVIEAERDAPTVSTQDPEPASEGDIQAAEALSDAISAAPVEDEMVEIDGILLTKTEAEALAAEFDDDDRHSLDVNLGRPPKDEIEVDDKASVDVNLGRPARDQYQRLSSTDDRTTFTALEDESETLPSTAATGERQLPGDDWAGSQTVEQPPQEYADPTVDDFFEAPKSPRTDDDESWIKGSKKGKKGKKGKKSSISSMSSSAEKVSAPSTPTAEKEMTLPKTTVTAAIEEEAQVVGSYFPANVVHEVEPQEAPTLTAQAPSSTTKEPALAAAFDPGLAEPTLERSINPFDQINTDTVPETPIDESGESSGAPLLRRASKKSKKRKSVIWADAESAPGTPANESGLELIVPPSPERVYTDEPEEQKATARFEEELEKTGRRERNVDDLEPEIFSEPEQIEEGEVVGPTPTTESSEPSTPADVEGEDEWLVPVTVGKKGKKDKKKKKKSSVFEDEAPVETEAIEEPTPVFDKLPTADEVVLDRSVEPELLEQPIEAPEPTPVLIEEPVPEVQATEDDEWGVTTKKSKKDKKKKKSSFSEAEPQVESEPLEEPAPVSDLPSADDAVRDKSAESELLVRPVEGLESSTVLTEEPVPDVQAAEVEWAMPAKKSKKDKKKKRGSTTSLQFDEPQDGVSVPTEDTAPQAVETRGLQDAEAVVPDVVLAASEQDTVVDDFAEAPSVALEDQPLDDSEATIPTVETKEESAPTPEGEPEDFYRTFSNEQQSIAGDAQQSFEAAYPPSVAFQPPTTAEDMYQHPQFASAQPPHVMPAADWHSPQAPYVMPVPALHAPYPPYASQEQPADLPSIPPGPTAALAQPEDDDDAELWYRSEPPKFVDPGSQASVEVPAAAEVAAEASAVPEQIERGDAAQREIAIADKEAAAIPQEVITSELEPEVPSTAAVAEADRDAGLTEPISITEAVPEPEAEDEWAIPIKKSKKDKKKKLSKSTVSEAEPSTEEQSAAESARDIDQPVLFEEPLVAHDMIIAEPEEITQAAAVAREVVDEPQVEVVHEPAIAEEEWSVPTGVTKSKKDKKKKKQSIIFDEPSEPASEDVSVEPTIVDDATIDEPNFTEDDVLLVEESTAKEIVQPAAEDPVIEITAFAQAEDVQADDEWASSASSKKSKKDKKKRKSALIEDLHIPEPASTELVAEAMPISEEPTAIEPDPQQELEQPAARDIEGRPEEIPPEEDEWALPTSSKNKKDKKKKKSMQYEELPESEPASADPAAEAISTSEEPAAIEPEPQAEPNNLISREVDVQPEEVQLEEDEWALPSSSKKKKDKKKKRKSTTFESEAGEPTSAAVTEANTNVNYEIPIEPVVEGSGVQNVELEEPAEAKDLAPELVGGVSAVTEPQQPAGVHDILESRDIEPNTISEPPFVPEIAMPEIRDDMAGMTVDQLLGNIKSATTDAGESVVDVLEGRDREADVPAVVEKLSQDNDNAGQLGQPSILEEAQAPGDKSQNYSAKDEVDELKPLPGYEAEATIPTPEFTENVFEHGPGGVTPALNEPKAPEEATEDDWSMPISVKKSKKDKKQKKRRSVAEDLSEPVTEPEVETATPALAAELAERAAEFQAPTNIEDEPSMAAESLARELDLTAEPETTALLESNEPAAEDEWSMPTLGKKSKKDKKKKRKSVIEDEESTPATTEPQTEAEEPYVLPSKEVRTDSDLQAPTSEVEPTVEPASAAPAIEAAVQDEIFEKALESTEQPEVVETQARTNEAQGADEWSFTTSDKKAKDKKKKKKGSQAQISEPVTPAVEVEDPFTDAAQVMSTDQLVPEETMVMPDIEEPLVEEPPLPAGTVEAPEHVRDLAAAAAVPQIVSQDVEMPDPASPDVQPESRDDFATAEAYFTTPQEMPVTTKIEEARGVPEVPGDREVNPFEAEDAWAVPVKKSKKDKKKRKSSAFDSLEVIEPPAGESAATETPEFSEAPVTRELTLEPETTQDLEASTTSAAPETIEEDWTTSTSTSKKSKKDKKKKRKSTAQDEASEPIAAEPEALEDPDQFIEPMAVPPTFNDNMAQIEDIRDVEPESDIVADVAQPTMSTDPAIESYLQDVSTDFAQGASAAAFAEQKDRDHRSAEIYLPQAEQDVAITEAEEKPIAPQDIPLPIEEPSIGREIVADEIASEQTIAAQSEQTIEPELMILEQPAAAVNEDDEWAVPTKKSKKDKKGKKSRQQSVAEDFDSITTTPAGEASVEAAPSADLIPEETVEREVPVDIVAETQDPRTTEAEVENEWSAPSTDKKSKKDKKKKKSSRTTSVADESRLAIPQEEPETIIAEPVIEPSNFVGFDAIPETTHGLPSEQTILPAEIEFDPEVSKDTTMEEAVPEAISEAVLEPAVVDEAGHVLDEPAQPATTDEPEDWYTTAAPKKSKKDKKKKKRGSTFDDVDTGLSEPETPAEPAVNKDIFIDEPAIGDSTAFYMPLPEAPVAVQQILGDSVAGDDPWDRAEAVFEEDPARTEDADRGAFQEEARPKPSSIEENPSPGLVAEATAAGAVAIGVAMLSQEEPVAEPEDEWSMPSKKSKKDKKKKRKSTVDETETHTDASTPFEEQSEPVPSEAHESQDREMVDVVDVIPAHEFPEHVEELQSHASDIFSTEDVEPLPLMETTRQVETTVEPVPIVEEQVREDEWAMPAKKSKKDKKKKRQSIMADDETGTSTPAVETDIEPLIGQDTFQTPPDALRQTDFAAAEQFEQPSKDEEPAIPAPTPAEEDWSFPVSGKKPKKDKKKRKSTVPDEEMTIATPVIETDLEPMLVQDATQESLDALRQTDLAAAETFEESSQLEEAVIPTPAPVEEDWSFPVPGKKSKKDKKTRKSGTATPQEELAMPFEFTGELEPSMQADEPILDSTREGESAPVTSAVEADVDDEWAAPSSKQAKKEKKKRKSTLVEASSYEPTPRDSLAEIETPIELLAEREVVVEPPNALQPVEASRNLDLEEQPLAAATAVVEAVDEWAVPTKKSKKDKKKKSTLVEASNYDPTPRDSLAGVESQIEPLNEREITADDLTILQPMETSRNLELEEQPLVAEPVVAEAEDEWAVPTKKSKKDKKKRKSTSGEVSNYDPTPQESETHAADITRNISATETVPPPAQFLEDVYNDFAPRQEREIIGKSDSMIIEPLDPEGTTLEPRVPRTTEHETQSPEPESFYRMDIDQPGLTDIIRDLEIADAPLSRKSSKRSTKSQGSRKSATSVPDVDLIGEETSRIPRKVSQEWLAQTEPIRAEDSDGSQISETTRERRRRRRSPRLTTDHDPADLPRDRALTPPPDHDDLMDTALGIAAGLGLGAAAGAAQAPREQARTERALPAQEPPGWSFANIDQPRGSVRDSGVQFDSPMAAQNSFARQRDSGFEGSPHAEQREGKRSIHDERAFGSSLRVERPRSPTSSTEDVLGQAGRRSIPSGDFDTPLKRQSSDVESTTKERDSVLFKSSPAGPGATPRTPAELAHLRRLSASSPNTPAELAHLKSASSTGNRRTSPSLRMVRDSLGNLRGSTTSPSSLRSHKDSYGNLRDVARSPLSPQSEQLTSNLLDRVHTSGVDRQAFSPSPRQSTNRPFSPRDSIDRAFSPRSSGLDTINENTGLALGAAALGIAGGAALMAGQSRERSGGPLSKSRTNSLRNLRSVSAEQQAQQYPADGPGGERSASMAESFDGYGAAPASPRSPSRPPSLRKRQSLNQVLDLQTRVEQLATENRALAEQKLVAERHIEELHLEHQNTDTATEEALRTVNEQLRLRDDEIVRLRQEIEGIAAARDALREEHENKYTLLLNEKDTAHARLTESTREVADLRGKHDEVSRGVEGIVAAQVAATITQKDNELESALASKDAELIKLRRDLDLARAKIRDLQSRILARGVDEVVVVRDEDYFENACQQLCQHVQQWVLRFSKFSDTRVCRATSEVRDEKIVDRFDNAILDGSDVDLYLGDRVKRRDVFMSVVMTMIWEFVFTRYLFGMDRDQRQKLKQLEKNLMEVGPASAVHQWRALTLTLLAKRQQFKTQKEADSEAVATEILQTLSKFLPPPQNLEGQIFESLRNVMRAAVKLSIEMRTQKAEYIMLPPLQPEYDTNGDLARKVFFNASLMNERSGEHARNEDLEVQQAVVRMVLVPLVVKKEITGSSGEGTEGSEEEIVVCPAQVLVARVEKGKKSKDRRSGGTAERERAQSRMSQAAMASTHSLGAMSGVHYDEGNVI